MTSGAPSARSLLTSFALHVAALILLLLIPAAALSGAPPKKQIDVVFHRPPPIEIPVAVNRIPLPEAGAAAGPPLGSKLAPAPKPKPEAPEGPEGPGKPDLQQGPGDGAPAPETPQQRVGKAGILAFKDKIQSLSQDRMSPRLGADARFGAADDKGRPASGSLLTTTKPGGSGGINLTSLSRTLGGGGGGGGGAGGGGGGGGGGLGVGRATSPSAGIGGGERPLARGGPGPSRTDEEIQIVFDRYKAQFYRLYNRALRNDPTLKGQMVLRLTIEPDGSVSMCKLQSSDMNAPDLAEQVVSITRTINFGAKEGVQALTIAYPIDFLPAE